MLQSFKNQQFYLLFGLPNDKFLFWQQRRPIQVSKTKIFWNYMKSCIREMGSKWSPDHCKEFLIPAQDKGTWRGRDLRSCTHASGPARIPKPLGPWAKAAKFHLCRPSRRNDMALDISLFWAVFWPAQGQTPFLTAKTADSGLENKKYSETRRRFGSENRGSKWSPPTRRASGRGP